MSIHVKEETADSSDQFGRITPEDVLPCVLQRSQIQKLDQHTSSATSTICGSLVRIYGPNRQKIIDQIFKVIEPREIMGIMTVKKFRLKLLGDHAYQMISNETPDRSEVLKWMTEMQKNGTVPTRQFLNVKAKSIADALRKADIAIAQGETNNEASASRRQPPVSARTTSRNPSRTVVARTRIGTLNSASAPDDDEEESVGEELGPASKQLVARKVSEIGGLLKQANAESQLSVAKQVEVGTGCLQTDRAHVSAKHSSSFCLDDLRRITLKNLDLYNFRTLKAFEQLVVGCFVKACGGFSQTQNSSASSIRLYRIEKVKTAKEKYHYRNTLLDKLLVLRGRQGEAKITDLSCQEPTQAEFDEWMRSAEITDIPTKTFVRRKIGELEATRKTTSNVNAESTSRSSLNDKRPMSEGLWSANYDKRQRPVNGSKPNGIVQPYRADWRSGRTDHLAQRNESVVGSLEGLWSSSGYFGRHRMGKADETSRGVNTQRNNYPTKPYSSEQPLPSIGRQKDSSSAVNAPVSAFDRLWQQQSNRYSAFHDEFEQEMRASRAAM